MIRDNIKIYAEANDPNTVATGNTLTSNKYLQGAGGRDISAFDPAAVGIQIMTAANQLGSFAPIGPNRILGTDASGNLTWLTGVV